MTAPTTHWSTTGRLHTGTVDGCGACGKGSQACATAPRSDLQAESVPVAHRADVIRRNLRILAHETATPPRDHDADGECCRRAERGPDDDAQEGAQ